MEQNFKVSLLDKIKTPIINKFYDFNHVKGRANKQDDVWVVRNNNDIIAACRIQNISGELFLSTLYVMAEMRNKGIAKRLIIQIINHYQNTKYTSITTFPYAHLKGLYASAGFICCEHLPEHFYTMYNNYQKQGRKISAMRHSINTYD